MIPYPEVEPADGARADDGPVTSDHRPYPLQSPGGPGGSAPALVIDYSPASSSSGPFDSGTTDQRYPSQSYGTHVVATRARGGSPDGPPGPVHSARDRRSSTRGPTPTMSRRAMSPTPPTTLPARPPAPAPPPPPQYLTLTSAPAVERRRGRDGGCGRRRARGSRLGRRADSPPRGRRWPQPSGRTAGPRPPSAARRAMRSET